MKMMMFVGALLVACFTGGCFYDPGYYAPRSYYDPLSYGYQSLGYYPQQQYYGGGYRFRQTRTIYRPSAPYGTRPRYIAPPPPARSTPRFAPSNGFRRR